MSIVVQMILNLVKSFSPKQSGFFSKA